MENCLRRLNSSMVAIVWLKLCEVVRKNSKRDSWNQLKKVEIICKYKAPYIRGLERNVKKPAFVLVFFDNS